MAKQLADGMHPNVVDRLLVPPTNFWGKSLKEGEKVTVGFEDKDLVLTNVALSEKSEEARLLVTTDCGTAILSTLTTEVPHAKVWYRVKVGQNTTIIAKKGGFDLMGYTVTVWNKPKKKRRNKMNTQDVPDIDCDDILPPINLPVDKLL